MRDRLIGLANNNPDTWAMGYQDECWWSRVALPALHGWAEKSKPLRFVEQSVSKDDPDPKAISCYGLYLPQLKETWLRFVDGRPISGITTQFLSWCSKKLYARGKKVWLMIWDNAPWHLSKEVRTWIKEHNKKVKKGEIVEGVRIISCFLPTRSPWLNAIEPKWIHGKRKVVEADRLLSTHEIAERVCAAFGCPHYEHLFLAENVA
jgi:DDE superfamily endonuclease